MGIYKEKALDFLYGAGFIDEIKYNGNQVLIRAKNPEISGTVVVQGDERRGYEFLIFHSRSEYKAFGQELEDYGIVPKYYELEDGEKLTFKARFYNAEVPPVRYEVKINSERKNLYVEKKQNQNSNTGASEM